jgi:hypothetical protein
VCLGLFGVCALPLQADFLVSWEAAGGVLPDTTSPPWELVSSAATLKPTLEDGVMTMSTSTDPEVMYYRIREYDMELPPELFVEIRARIISGSSSVPSRGYVQLSVGTGAPGVFASLNIQHDEIFLVALIEGVETKVASTKLDTTGDFHTYRIEVSSHAAVGAPVRVYYDGSLMISDKTYYSANESEVARIYFGPASRLSHGTVQFTHVRHNAGGAWPRLTIRRLADEQVGVSWSALASQWVLETATDLLPGLWTHTTNTVSQVEDYGLGITQPADEPRRFFRLRQPAP